MTGYKVQVSNDGGDGWSQRQEVEVAPDVAEVGEVGRVFAGLCDAGEVGPGMASV